MPSLVLALQVLTRLPLPSRPATTMAELGRSVVWFPLAGALIGLMLAVVDQAAVRIFAPTVANAAVVFALVAITGAFHLDGLIDAVDGLTSGPDAATRLAAMRQRVAGVPGALAGCGMVFALFVALGNLPLEARFAGLVLAPMCGQSAILLGYALFPYGRSEPGLSLAMKEGATPLRSLLGLGVGIGVAAIAGQAAGLALIAGALVVSVSLGQLALRRLPGLTGDIHGAICEVTQLGVLLAAPAVLLR